MMPMGMMHDLDDVGYAPHHDGGDGGSGMRFPPQANFLGGMGQTPFIGGMDDFQGLPRHRDGGYMPDGGRGKGGGGLRLTYAPDLSLDQLTEDRRGPPNQGKRGGGGKGGKGRGKRADEPEPMRVLSDMMTPQLPTGMPLGSLLPAGVSDGHVVPPSHWADTTTIMMRNLPNKYTQRMLLTEVNQVGFLGTFDFLYLPIDPETSANRGYAFLNFIDPSFAWMFKMSYEGRKMNRFNSSKVVSVMPATLQGFDANYTHYSTARVNRGDPAARPLFLREPTQPLLKAAGRGDGFNKRGNRRKGNGQGNGDQLPQPGPPMMPAPGRGQKGGFDPMNGGPAMGGPDLTAMMGAPPMPGNGDGDASVDRPSVPKFCPHCGGPIQQHFQFCPHCGSNVDFTNLKGMPT